MNRYIIGIDGMMCGMCEMHVEQRIKESFRLKKAKASHITNKLTVIAEGEFSKIPIIGYAKSGILPPSK